MTATKIQDFGQKIGGARKDAWKTRGLELDDITEMNDAEIKHYVTKDSVWPKPNWEEMIAGGEDKLVCFWQNEVRKSLPKDFTAMTGEDRHERYIAFVHAVKERVMNIKCIRDAKGMLGWLKAEGYVEPISTYRYLVKEKWGGVITNPFFKAIQATDEFTLKRKKTYPLFGVPKAKAGYETVKNQTVTFCYDGDKVSFVKDEQRNAGNPFLIIKKGQSTHYFYPKECAEYQETWKIGTWLVADMEARKILAYNLDSEECAKSKLEEIANAAPAPSTKSAKSAKKAFRYPQLDWIKRTGKDWRHGMDASPELLTNMFGFRGGEFGNWIGDKERQENLNHAYDAFMDLADVLQTDPAKLTFSGTLSIAFGARGKGGASATAHYEPLRRVINLTRMKGAGCLAHEWAHALDYYAGDAFNSASDGMTPATETKRNRTSKGTNTELSVQNAFMSVVKTMLTADGSTWSRYYTDSYKFDQIYRKGGHGYWSSTCEMFARAFDCYLTDKLKEAGIVSQYLTAHADSFKEEENGKMYYAYPIGEDRTRINAALDQLLAVLRAVNVL